MPRLLLLRHAKAERARAGMSDHGRALTKDGRKDSEEAGQAIAERGDKPDLVLCSDSSRTHETWDRAKPQLKGKPEVRFLRAIYDAADTYLPILRDEAGEAETVLVIGHNPAIQATAVQLAADLSSRDGRTVAERFPKAGIAVLDFDGAWHSLRPRAMRFIAFLAPHRD